MIEQAPHDYNFTDDEIKHIGGWVILPPKDRAELMNDFFSNKEKHEIINMFSNFIDMANTVISNCKEQAIMCAIAEWHIYPHDAEKINMPDMLGAINGYKIAQDIPNKLLCHGCAFRKGSVANTCLTTVHDTNYCNENSQIFMCHENINNKGEPTRKCRGFLKNTKRKDAAQ